MGNVRDRVVVDGHSQRRMGMHLVLYGLYGPHANNAVYGYRSVRAGLDTVGRQQ